MKTPKATSTKNNNYQLPSMCHAMFIDEINNCVIFYLSNDVCAKALKHGIIVTIETNPPRCKFPPN